MTDLAATLVVAWGVGLIVSGIVWYISVDWAKFELDLCSRYASIHTPKETREKTEKLAMLLRFFKWLPFWPISLPYLIYSSAFFEMRMNVRDMGLSYDELKKENERLRNLIRTRTSF